MRNICRYCGYEMKEKHIEPFQVALPGSDARYENKEDWFYLWCPARPNTKHINAQPYLQHELEPFVVDYVRRNLP